MHAQTSYLTPVINTPDFNSYFGGKDGKSLLLDDQGLLRCVETILLPKTPLTITEKLPNYICRVQIPSYPGENFYIDKRFLKIKSQIPNISLSQENPPIIEKICKTLKKLQGLPYLWGGNWPKPIEQMLEFYRPSTQISSKEKRIWQLQGMDCSGLLYYATQGYTPRNTSSLVNYGKTLAIEGLREEQISQMVKPLDLIVWKGHVIIVLDSKNIIESTPKEGVHMQNISERIKEVMEDRIPLNQYSSSFPSFIICRWHTDSLHSEQHQVELSHPLKQAESKSLA